MVETVISEDGVYRYSLTREVNLLGEGVCLFGMHNPSKADAEINDPTIRRDIGFARAWGYRYLWVVNLGAYRATYPKDLQDVANPIGPENDHYMLEMAQCADLFVCAWGAGPLAESRGQQVKNMLQGEGVKLHHLGLTKHGFPKHPLYLKADTQPQVWAP